MVIKSKNLVIIFVLIITALTFVFCFGALYKLNVKDADANSITVVIDAGHGGIDNGVVGKKTGVKESELNLSVSKKLENILVDAGINVVLTRNTDAGLYGLATKNLKKKDMEKRKNIITSANPTLVVSVHMNKYSVSSRRGAQVFYKDGDEKGKAFAECVQRQFNDLGSSQRDFSALTGDYYILKCSSVPSIIAECGFLSNENDEALLITEEYQREVAYTIFKGIVEYLSLQSIRYF